MVESKRIMPIVGVRPQIIKAAPVIHALSKTKGVQLQLVHSGQHYDYEMSTRFFEDMDLPNPMINLKVGSGSHTYQTATMMLRLENVITKNRPDIVVVFGDANTTLAGALSAAKMGIRVAHVEAGLRSGDMRMPEEMNRILVDHCAQTLFAPTQTAVKNLLREGIYHGKIKSCGDTMVDSMLAMKAAMNHSEILSKLGIEPRSYAVMTTHRAENVDDPDKLHEILRAITQISTPVVFPVHPRTETRLKSFALWNALARSPNIKLTKPLPYIDMLELIRQSNLLMTDSGGLQKEAFLLQVPCLTLRDSTEWIETLHAGANRLVQIRASKIESAYKRIMNDQGLRRRLRRLGNPFGDGKAARKIVKVLLQ